MEERRKVGSAQMGDLVAVGSIRIGDPELDLAGTNQALGQEAFVIRGVRRGYRISPPAR